VDKLAGNPFDNIFLKIKISAFVAEDFIWLNTFLWDTLSLFTKPVLYKEC